MASIESVRLFNVGQGDASLLVLDTGWRVLVDGGREGDIAPFADYLVEDVKHVDLLLGTHFDADHLEGLASLVERGLTAEQAVLPPHVHPDGARAGHSPWSSSFEGASPLLVDHLQSEESLGEVYRSLDLRASETHALVGELGSAVERRARRRSRSSRNVRISEEATRAAGIANESSLHALARLLEVGGSIASAGTEGRLQRRFIAGTERIAKELISATSLKRLVHALNLNGIPWVAPTAPDRAEITHGRARAASTSLWHIAPAKRFVDHYADKISAVWDQVFFAMASLEVQMPTLSNQLSHVVVIGDNKTSIAFTGDSGFQGTPKTPDSMSTGWEVPFGSVDAIHLPHHCGRWGRFAQRSEAVLGSRSGQLVLYGSVAHNKSSPPNAQAVGFLKNLSLRRRARFHVANVPGGPMGKFLNGMGLPSSPGPPMLELDARSGWGAMGLDDRGKPSPIRPLGLDLPQQVGQRITDLPHLRQGERAWHARLPQSKGALAG